MRRAAKVDANQAEIVRALRAVGAVVTSTASAGSGFPDLAVGYRGKTFLLEVKDGSRPPSERRLTPAQEEWHAAWRGQVAVVETVQQALEVIGAVRAA